MFDLSRIPEETVKISREEAEAAIDMLRKCLLAGTPEARDVAAIPGFEIDAIAIKVLKAAAAARLNAASDR